VFGTSFAGPLVALSLVLISMTTAPLVTDGSAGTLPSWKSYFPTKSDVGRACTLTLPPETASDSAGVVTTTGTQDETLLAVDATRAGEVYTFRMKVVTHQTQGAPIVPASLSSTSPNQTLRFTQTLKYLVRNNGTVEAPLENQQSVQSEFGFKGHFMFPSVADIAKGQGESSQMTFWFSSSTAAGRASIEAVTRGHSKSIEGSLEVGVTGILRGVINTPSGTFHNVIGLRETTKHIIVLNATSPAIATMLQQEMRDADQTTITTFWYAPHRGMVSRWDVSSNGTKTIEDTVCASK
jgi:hypothetical protein